MLDMRNVVCAAHVLVHIGIIVALVGTEMLFNFVGRRSLDDDGKDQIISGPFIMCIGTGDVQRERHTVLINQQMNLAALLAPIGGVLSSGFTSEWRGRRFAVDRLPFPTDFALGLIERDHLTEHGAKDTHLLPGLEPLIAEGVTLLLTPNQSLWIDFH